MSTQRKTEDSLLSASRGLLYALLFLLPLFFLPITLDILEINKQTLLLVLVFASALLWIGSMMKNKQFVFRRGWINIFPVLLLAGMVVSAFYSVAPYLSWVGSMTQEYTSALTAFGGVILFYLLVNTTHERAAHRIVHFWLLLSAVIVGLVGSLSIMGASVFSFSFAQNLVFNTIGSLSTFAIYLVIMTIFAGALLVSHKKQDALLHNGFLGFVEHLMIVLLFLITFFVLLVIDFALLWLIFSLGIIFLMIFALFRAKDFQSSSKFILPVLLLLLGLPFWFWFSSPFNISLPVEVVQTHTASMGIANSALQSFSSSYGSGPGTYLFDYTMFHDAGINETNFWNTRFDRSSSFYTTLLATTGFIGTGVWLLFILVLALRSLQQIIKPQSREEWLQSFVAFMPWLTLVVASFLYPFNMTLMFLFFAFSGLLGSQVITKTLKKSYSQAPSLALLFSAVFMIGSLVFLVGIFVTAQRYGAEIAYAKAVRLDRDGASTEDVVKYLDKAATWNRFHDGYYRSLARTLLLRVDDYISESSSGVQMTEESRSYVQGIVASSVNAAVRATELSPYNVQNWLTRGVVYQELMPLMSDAEGFAIEAHTKAVELEPFNPSHWTELGQTYLSAAELKRPLTVAEDKSVSEQAKVDLQEMLQKAHQSFQKAIELRPAYSPAHYQVAVALEREGKLDEAVGKMEAVAKYNQLDVGVAFQLGLLYLRRGGELDLKRAKNSFEYAISLAPAYANARWFLASIYEREKDFAAAAHQVEKVLELDPGNELVKTRLDRLLTGQVTKGLPESLK